MKKLSTLLAFITVTICVFLCSCLNTSAADLGIPSLNIKEVTYESATISWNETEGVYGYKVSMKSPDSDGYIALGATKKTYFTVSGLDGETEYMFIVKPFIINENGKRDFGESSEPLSVITKLEKVTDIELEKATASSLTLSWNEVKGAVKYRVKYSVGDSDKYVIVGDVEDEKITIKDLDASGKYKIRISAMGKKVNSGFCKAVGVYCTPKQVAKPEKASVDDHCAKISWDKVDNANKYYIYAATSSDGKYKKVGETKKQSFVYKINEPSATRYIKVAAVIETSRQLSVGKQSKCLKVTTKSIEINAPSSARCGEHPEIEAVYYGSKVKWKSSDSSVIKIKSGDFRACGNGKAKITAEYKGSKTSVTVKVTSPVIKYRSCVYDYTNDRYIFDSRINERCYPASITKLITALTTLQYMSLNDTIVVGSELNLVEPLSSRCGIRYGEKYKLGDLLYGLLLPSGGDAAYSIAVNCARKVSGRSNMGYVEAKNYFVSLMNKYMTSIGATGTHCVNPHGYPVDGHYTTVHDLVLVAKKVLADPTLKKITSTPSKYVVDMSGNGRTWSTTNGLINPYSYFYSPYAHGMKTGTVNDNYTGIVSAATKNGRTIITVVIGCESYDARYVATRTLYNYYL